MSTNTWVKRSCIARVPSGSPELADRPPRTTAQFLLVVEPTMIGANSGKSRPRIEPTQPGAVVVAVGQMSRVSLAAGADAEVKLRAGVVSQPFQRDMSQRAFAPEVGQQSIELLTPNGFHLV